MNHTAETPRSYPPAGEAAASMPVRVTPGELRDWLARPDRPRLIDVRSAAEFRAGHIPGSCNVPLPMLREHRDDFARPLGDHVVLICSTDGRAQQAEEILAGAGLTRLHVLAGGMAAWRQIDGQVDQIPGPWELERQIRLVAGGIVLTSILASTIVPNAKWVAGFIGAGLVTAALTNTCMMGVLLSKLPHNRKADPTPSEVLRTLAG